MRRRTLLAAGAVVASASAAGAWAYRSGQAAVTPLGVPSVPPGPERCELRYSKARGSTVDFYTAVPAGHGDGAGLPVCLVLHGGSKRPADFAGLGLGRFLTDAVNRGAAPFVLAGATGDRLAWQPSGRDDPQRMLHDELPAWCAARGFDAGRLAAWGWSMGGYGALLLAEAFPRFVRAVAAFSPAVVPGDAVFDGVDRLAGTPVGLWCGRADPLVSHVRALRRALPGPPVAGGFGPGKHNFEYWSTVIPAAFTFVAARLSVG
ncbi:putative esterase [Actinoplanes octamycinicus]|uniref:Putative esterase n=1 Tax=Actinoplanes octamycinicus TaxID=135948 RepID=A0A7W7GZH8_9ACTN|nr:alpha/beta hydrolase-fold protein [Actinoplanes octamycinicus]MBB4741102.1 putative esterase [Actinoplanes octamycinicus]GIE56007.1 esterase [Actinoplanes octamycinicus]